MEGSYRNSYEEINKREALFNQIVGNYGTYGEDAANTYVSTRNGNKRIRDISIIDGEELFNSKIAILIRYIPRDILENINKENTPPYYQNNNNTSFQSYSEGRSPFAPIGGGMKNQKVKKCEKKKVVLGKERCIYKVSGSKKDYMKYKGKLVPVTDYIKSMKKKN
jgi:hypothetical protein